MYEVLSKGHQLTKYNDSERKQDRWVLSPCILFSVIYIHKFSKNKRMTSAPPTKVPILLPKFAKRTTSNIRVTLLFQKPFTLYTSSASFSKSATLGLRKSAWTIPAKNPVARKGLSEVIGAAIKEEIIAKG